jgi:hypothetical protein
LSEEFAAFLLFCIRHALAEVTLQLAALPVFDRFRFDDELA